MIVIVAVAAMRMLIVFAPERYFDVDPAFDPMPLAGLGPVGSLALDVALLMSCAIALVGEWLGRRGIAWTPLALALLPLPIVLWHGHADLLHLWRGITWQAAIIAAVTVAHLARDRTMRLMVIATLIGVTGPLIFRGISQVTIEHAQTISLFEKRQDEFLRDRGWEPGSPNALIYERRLRQPQPLGWFATTNVFASAMLPLLAVGAGLALALRRTALPSGWPGLLIVFGVAALAGIWFSGSKGALLIALITIATVALPHVPRIRTRLTKSGSPLACGVLLALPLVALAGVVFRGVLPEGVLGDRSLLFRWHYLVSSAGIFADAPLLGVGPDGFQEQYTQHRLPRNPEEVVSAHSMFIDWLCMLGVMAAAWCALVLGMLWRAARRVRPTAEYVDGQDMESTMRRLARVAAVMLVVAIMPAMAAEIHVLDAYALTLRMFGAVAFVGLTLVLGYVMLNVDQPLMNWSIAVAVAALVMHGQIEMTFFQSGFVVWGLCLLGAAGAAAVHRADGPADTRTWWSLMWPGVIAGIAVWITISSVIPAMQQAQEVRAAAAMLFPLADDPEEAVSQRRQASTALVAAYETFPRHRLPLLHAVHQLERAAARSNESSATRSELLLEAMALADRAVDEHPRSESLAARYRIATALVVHAEDAARRADALDTAVADARTLAERDPHGISGWRRLGDALWLAGRRAEAATAYRRALEADANFTLDPLKQLPERERNRLVDRVAAVEDG